MSSTSEITKNYYELLGVGRDATTKEIKEAYREVARVYHPDSNFYDEIIADAPTDTGVDMYKVITAAYNTLVHEQKREEYNNTLAPELAGWEKKEEAHDTAEFSLPKKRANSMGTFGNLQKSQFDDIDVFKQEEIRAMSEVISLKRGFWHKIKRFLNL